MFLESIMLNKLASIIVLSGLAFSLVACQSTPTAPVLTRADNTYETTGLGESKVKAQRAALESAQKQCGSKTPIILNDTTTYNGVIDEKMGRVIEQGVGVVGAVLGKPIPDLGRNDDYEYQIKFKCQ